MHLVDQIKAKAKSNLQTVVLPEGYDDRMIHAAGQIVREGLARVVLLGNPATLRAKAGELGADPRRGRTARSERVRRSWKPMSISSAKSARARGCPAMTPASC